jgi:polysaccharide biosynthesis protein PslH
VRILVLALGVPFPPIGGGLTRTFHLLKAIAPWHEVTLAAFTYGQEHHAAPYPLRVETVPWQWSSDYEQMIGADADASAAAYERLAHQTEQPWFASAVDPASMSETIQAILAVDHDLVLLEGTPMARFLPALPERIPIVLDLFDVHSVMEQVADGREFERTLAFERAAVSASASCLAVSEADANAARTLLGAKKVHVVPNGVDTGYFLPSAMPIEAGSLLFTGRMNYAPNVDAARFFALEILPLVRAVVPHARFHIVGADPAPEVSALASESVVVHGRVEDVRPYLANSNVVVVPVRAGGGTRLKVLEAAASAKAIVSTRLGVEGLAFNGGEIVIADQPQAFADATIALLEDDQRCGELGARARNIAGRYEWIAIGESFRRVVETAGQG